ncbi:MAG: hypothetical protein AAF602_19915 [Myxococcota bacterium]
MRPLPVAPAAVLESAAWQVLTDVAPTGTLDAVRADDAYALLRAFEGLPLSLVLAAGRLEVLTWSELLAWRHEPLTVLADPDRTGPHASLEAAIGGAFTLLDPALQDVLCQAGAFAGTFDLPAARDVIAYDGIVVDALQRLLRRNLLERRDDGYRLPDAVRDFVRRHSESPEAVRRHAEHYGDRARWRDKDRGKTRKLLDDTGRLVPELDAIIDRAGHDPSLVDAALRAASGRMQWSCRREAPTATARAAKKLLALVDDEPSPEAGRRLTQIAIMHSLALRQLGDRDGATTAAEQAVTFAAISGVPYALANAHSEVAGRLREEGDLQGAEALLREALEATTIPRFAAHFRAEMAFVVAALRGFEAAAPWMDEAIAHLLTDPPEPDVELQIRKAEGWLYMAHPERYARGTAAFQRAYALATEMGQPRVAGFARETWASSAARWTIDRGRPCRTSTPPSRRWSDTATPSWPLLSGPACYRPAAGGRARSGRGRPRRDAAKPAPVGPYGVRGLCGQPRPPPRTHAQPHRARPGGDPAARHAHGGRHRGPRRRATDPARAGGPVRGAGSPVPRRDGGGLRTGSTGSLGGAPRGRLARGRRGGPPRLHDRGHPPRVGGGARSGEAGAAR